MIFIIILFLLLVLLLIVVIIITRPHNQHYHHQHQHYHQHQHHHTHLLFIRPWQERAAKRWGEAFDTTIVIHHTSHVTRHTSKVHRQKAEYTDFFAQEQGLGKHFTRHMSHVTRYYTLHVTRHTSHVTRHTSHVTRHQLQACPEINLKPHKWYRCFPFSGPVCINGVSFLIIVMNKFDFFSCSSINIIMVF